VVPPLVFLLRPSRRADLKVLIGNYSMLLAELPSL